MRLPNILLTLFPLFSIATPIALTPRAAAGGPALKPLPPICHLTNPLPPSHSNYTTKFKPSTPFSKVHNLYASYFDLPTSTDELWTMCTQQCYGYGDEGECKSVLLARDVPVPEGYHGEEGGELRVACLIFDKEIGEGDFEEAVAGTWRDLRVGRVRCGV
jgi:hypothetical protein